MPQDDGTILFEGARLIFKNFRGAEGRYNEAGDRNFSVRLDEETAEELAAAGWNVKRKPPREEGEDPLNHLPVTVGFGKGRPPVIYLITSKGRRRVGEEEVMLLDYLDDVKNIDLIVRPYNWGPIKGEYGRKAYLKELFITINESVLELKYADVPDISVGPDFNVIEGQVVEGRLAIER